MPDGTTENLRQRAVFTIPTNRSFADSLVAGLIARYGRDPLSLAKKREVKKLLRPAQEAR